MPGVLKKNVSSAGGTITGGSTNVFINGAGAVRVGDTVASHVPGGVHNSSTMAQGSSTVFVNGIALCRDGDAASCGHSGSGGSSDVIAG